MGNDRRDSSRARSVNASRGRPFRGWILAPVALVLTAVAGCEAGSVSEPVAGSTAEALLAFRCAPGYKPTDCDCQTCDPGECKTPKTSCTCTCVPDCPVNNYCKTWSKTTTTPVFDPAISNISQGACTYDTSVSDLLAAAGCEPERYYTTTGNEFSRWAISICPKDKFIQTQAQLDEGTSGILQCDSCTGDPGPNGVVVAWLTDAVECGCPVAGHCENPGACDDMSCLAQSQQDSLNSSN
jgi:hypothetical protein